MMKMLIVSSLLVIAIRQISGQCLTINDQKPPQSMSKRNLYLGEQEFSLNLLRAVNQLEPEKNVFFSPYSTYHALLLTYFISAGQTEQFLRKTLRLDPSMDKADLMNAFKLDRFQTKLRAQQQDYEFTNANRIYVDNKINVRSCIPELFKEEFEKIDFYGHSEESRVSINKWVENQTHDMIKDLLTPGTIDQTTNLVLVNAGYFKGRWQYEFDANETKEEVFHINSNKRTLVQMMNLEGMLNYDLSEALDAQVVELPYKGETLSMYILLPPFLKEDGIANTLKKLTPERFQEVIRHLNQLYAQRTVKLSLPKFTLEHTIEMTPILESLGVGNLFRNDANFSLLSDKDRLSLGEGVHKAKIEVNERGTQAAAATTFFDTRIIEDVVAIVTCNRPFIFLLYNKETKTIVFIGIYRQPPTK